MLLSIIWAHVRLRVLLHEVESHVEHREVLVGPETAHLSLHEADLVGAHGHIAAHNHAD